LILLITVITLLFTEPTKVFIIFIICIASILFYYYHKRALRTTAHQATKEGFVENEALEKQEYGENILNSDKYDTPTANNPFSNLMLTDYVDNPNKPPAPPAFNPVVQNEIVKKAKQSVQKCNSTNPNFTDKLFSDVGEQLNFEQSLRHYGSNPSTTLPNDQQAFIDFCYGDLTSCKEGNLVACQRNMPTNGTYH